MAPTCNLYVDARAIDKLLRFVCNLLDGAQDLVAMSTGTDSAASPLSESRVNDTPVVTAATRALPALSVTGQSLQCRPLVRL